MKRKAVGFGGFFCLINAQIMSKQSKCLNFFLQIKCEQLNSVASLVCNGKKEIVFLKEGNKVRRPQWVFLLRCKVLKLFQKLF
jgi:hypothetical protein